MVESEQAAWNNENKGKCGLFPIPIQIYGGNTEPNLQATNCDRIFDSGFHLQIRGRITSWLMNPGMTEPEHGGLKVTLTQNGSHLVPSYGFMETVGILHTFTVLGLINTVSVCSRRRKDRHLVR